MSHRSFLIAVATSLLLLSGSARAQEAAAVRGTDETEAVRKKAIKLLESVAGQVDSLHSAENRARIGSNVAELLWDQDEKRARALFGAVEAEIKTGLNDADMDEWELRTLMVFLQLRSDTLDRIAKHDPEAALAFLRATRLPPDTELPYGLRDVEKSLELRLANQIAARNPELALKLGLESLEKGASMELLPVLAGLYKKDKPAALNFYKAIVDKLKSTNLAQYQPASELAFELAHGFQPPIADEQVYRDLIGVLLATALANGCANEKTEEPPEICFGIGTVFSKIEKYYGPRAAPLKRWSQDGEGRENWSFLAEAEVHDVFEKGTVDDILALGSKHPEMLGEIRNVAIMRAEASGDVTRARQIAEENPDEDQRRETLAQIEREQTWKSISVEKLAGVRVILASFRRDEQRLNFLFVLANQVSANDRKMALGFLSQASEIIDATKPGRTQLEERMALAVAYCSLKSDRAFAIMEAMLPKLNELVAAAATLDGFEYTYLRDGEWNMSAAGAVGGLLTGLAQNAGSFGRLDFDRAVNLATQFERPELRLMAQLKIAQGVMTDQPHRDLMSQRTVDIP
jgi:hypothetical protein